MIKHKKNKLARTNYPELIYVYFFKPVIVSGETYFFECEFADLTVS